jgi:ComF family protein
MWRELLEAVLGFVFPDRCAGCGQIGTLFCANCCSALRSYPGQVRRVPATLDEVRVGFVFSGPLRGAVHRLKYGRMPRMARPLGQLLASQLAGTGTIADALVPVPLHRNRLRERGYNQAEELARVLSRSWQLPIITTNMVRERTTSQQASLKASERAANVQGAFRWIGTGTAPKRILLIDDVLTTGATMGACAAALRMAGSEWVCGVALARSRPDLDGAVSTGVDQAGT